MRKVIACVNMMTTNRLTGLPIFLLVMYVMFFFSIYIGGAFQPFFNLSSQALFIELPKVLLQEFSAPDWMQCMVVHGIGRGLNVTITFIPVLLCMFLFLSCLENSGYIVRAAFVMNNLMNYLGLPGKSFIPMIMGFGCSVPAILSTKILHKRHQRILTIMMVPFISCGAKLAIYAIFVAAFFPNAGQNIVFSLYLTGILVAVFTGLVLRPSNDRKAKLVIPTEFVALKFPNLLVICRTTMQQLKGFIFKAGTIIIPLCMIIGALSHVKMNPSNDTVLALVGKKITPIFSPMGIEQDNWPAIVGLMTGIISKEVIIGTLTTLYEQELMLVVHEQKKTENKILSGVMIKNALLHPFAIKEGNATINSKVLGAICLKFNSSVAAFSYLLFVLLYCPCVSVVVIIMRELGFKWALFAVAWTTGIAYVVAVIFYQIFTASNKFDVALWLAGTTVFFVLLAYLVRLAIYKQYRGNKIRLIPAKVS